MRTLTDIHADLAALEARRADFEDRLASNRSCMLAVWAQTPRHHPLLPRILELEAEIRRLDRAIEVLKEEGARVQRVSPN